jgi:hypothetical protein
MQMATLEPGETLAQLLTRLEALEKRLAGGATEAPPSRQASSREPTSRYGASPTEPPRERTPSYGAPPSGPVAARSAPPPTPPRSIQASSAVPGSSLPLVASSASAAATAVLEEEPLLDGETLQRWEAAVQGVNGKKRMLGAFLQESRFLGATSRAVILAADDLHRSVVDECENRALVEAQLAEAFGRRIALQVVPLGVDDAAPARTDVRPLVERAKQWFDGDPIRRPSGESPRSER